MPTHEEIEEVLKRHFESWNSADRDTWISLFEPDVSFEDPVGGPRKQGTKAVEETWDTAFKQGQRWEMHPLFVRICGGEAALHARNVGHVDGAEIEIESIEFWRFSDTGRVSQLRTFFSPPGEVELDPYFSKVDSPET